MLLTLEARARVYYRNGNYTMEKLLYGACYNISGAWIHKLLKEGVC